MAPQPESSVTAMTTKRIGQLDGIPGLVWHANVRKVLGADLKVGDWLDTLDHSGARMICGVALPNDERGYPLMSSQSRVVMFSLADNELVRADVEYDVVDPNSQVAPDGSAL